MAQIKCIGRGEMAGMARRAMEESKGRAGGAL